MNQENRKRVLKFVLIICAITAVLILIINHILNIIRKERVKELQSDLLLVQAEIEIVKGKNNVNKDENPLRGIQISKIAKRVFAKEALKEYGIQESEYEKYYLLKESDLSQMNLKELVGKNTGTYIVNYDTYEVIYTYGYENTKGLWCYKVSEMNKDAEEIVSKPSAFVEETTEENKENSGEEKAEENKAEENKTEENKTEEAKPEEAMENSNQEGTTAEEEKTTITEEDERKYNYIMEKWNNIVK